MSNVLGRSLLVLVAALAACDGAAEPTEPTVFVGETSSGDAAVSVAVGPAEAVIYLCDGVGTSAWFFGTVNGGLVTAESEAGAAAQATIAGDRITGTVELAGGSVEFSAPLATGVAGIYLVEQSATRAEGYSATQARLEADLTGAVVSGTVTALDGEPVALDGTVTTFGEPTGVATWIVQADGEVKGSVTGTTGGGNCSIWSKIKQVMFGVDCSFF